MPTSSLRASGVYSLTHFSDEIIAAYSGHEFDSAHQRDFLKALSIAPEKIFLCQQVHGAEIIQIKDSIQWKERPQADGLITQQKGIAIGILTADCMPIYYFDPKQKAMGMVHAGWKGLHAGIVSKMIAQFQKLYSSNPKDLLVAIGPSIRACCYEVGEEFKSHFPQYYTPKNQPGKGTMDLIRAAKDSLLGLGVSAANLYDSGICTACPDSPFFSWRRDKTTDRMLSIMALKA